MFFMKKDIFFLIVEKNTIYSIIICHILLRNIFFMHIFFGYGITIFFLVI